MVLHQINYHKLSCEIGFSLSKSILDILKKIPELEHSNLNQYENRTINKLQLDSRTVSAGDVFIAYKGNNFDGRNYIKQALKNNAEFVLFEKFEKNELNEVVEHIENINNHDKLLGISNLPQYISLIAAEYYNNPSLEQNIYAVTGTNGKTSCCFILAQLLDFVNKHHDSEDVGAGVIGTVGYGEIYNFINCNKFNKLENTTPDPILLQKILYEFNQNNIKNIALEASSHALEQFRLSGINIATAIYTNLTHEHLDYHGNIDNYYEAKKKLFCFPSVNNIIINLDDKFGEKLLFDLTSDPGLSKRKNIWGYTLNGNICITKNSINMLCINDKNVQVYNKSKLIESLDASNLFHSRLIGTHNLYNLLAVIAALLSTGYKLETILAYIKSLKPVPGRLEIFRHKSKQVDIVVDYAHTPDALEKTLVTLRNYKKSSSTLWCIFGCGGDRDKTKRPEMGELAVKYADKVIITDDNPRTEVPNNIIEDIKTGVTSDNSVKIFAIINSRKEAIMTALQYAKEDDIILIAGKGHEDYQIYGTQKTDYNEREFVAGLINA